MKTLLLTLLLALPLHAGEYMARVFWEANAIQPTRYEIWAVAGSQLTMLGEADGTKTKTEIRIPFDEVTIKIRAVKDGLASEFSQPVKIESLYQQMLNLVRKEYSEDLQSWTTDVLTLTGGKPMITIVPTPSGKFFERLSLTPPAPTPTP